MRHKLVTFILKSHAESSKKSKKDKKSKKGTETPQDSEEDEVDELTKKIQADAAHLKIENADSEFMEDTSDEAVAQRQKELEMSSAVAKLLIDDEEEDGSDPLEDFARQITAEVETDTLTPEKAIEFADNLDIRHDKACVVLVQTLYTDKILTDKQVSKYAPIFLPFLTSDKSQKSLLGGVERLVAEIHPELLPRVALILKAIYECDLAPEEVFLAWAEKPSKK
jgi:translation initiation factor 5